MPYADGGQDPTPKSGARGRAFRQRRMLPLQRAISRAFFLTRVDVRRVRRRSHR